VKIVDSRIFHLVIVTFSRRLSSNLLTGIPPELGNLAQLQSLYAQNHRVLFINISSIDIIRILERSHSCIVSLSGNSPGISSMAPSRLSSATSLSYLICTLVCRILSFSLTIFMISNDLPSNPFTLYTHFYYPYLFFRSLSLTKLNGTIPSLLGNLINLRYLYTNRIVFFDNYL